MRQSEGGFTERFKVSRSDGKPIDPSRRYFVIDFGGSDPHHAPAAMNAYADSIQRENPQLADDLRDAIMHPEKYPAQHD
jgi:hypothetical protein